MFKNWHKRAYFSLNSKQKCTLRYFSGTIILNRISIITTSIVAAFIYKGCGVWYDACWQIWGKEPLNNIFISGKKEVFILHGRRKVRKTAIVKEVSKTKRAFFYMTRRISKTEQLDTFLKTEAWFGNIK